MTSWIITQVVDDKLDVCGGIYRNLDEAVRMYHEILVGQDKDEEYLKENSDVYQRPRLQEVTLRDAEFSWDTK